jgi:PAS domain S-box-containing protein
VLQFPFAVAGLPALVISLIKLSPQSAVHSRDCIWLGANQTLSLIALQPFVWHATWFQILALAGLAGGVSFTAWSRARSKFQQRIDRLRQQRALAAERARFASVLEATSDCVAFGDSNGRVLFMNAAGRRMIGLSAAEDLGDWYIRDLHPTWAAERVVQEGIQIAMSAGIWNGESALLHRDGHEIPISQVIVAHKGPGGRLDFLSTISRDITERKQVEEALEQSQERLRTIIRAEPECVKIVSREGTLLDMNPAGLAMLEAGSLEEAQSRPLWQFIAPEHRAEFGVLHHRVLQGQSGTLEFNVIGLKGACRSLETNAVPLRDPAGAVNALLGVTRDITLRKQSEAALRESEAQFRAIFEGAAIGVALVDMEGRPVKCNPALQRLLGYTEAELQTMAFPEFTHPDDVQADLQLSCGLKSGEFDHYQIEKRYLRKDGQVLWCRLTVSLVQTQDAKPKFGVGMVEDITAHRLAEESLSENQRVLATLLSNLPGMVYRGRNDLHRTMEFVSEGSRDLVGYMPAELMDAGKVFLGKLVHPQDRERVWGTIQAALQARKPFELNYRISTSASSEKWVWERGQGIFSTKEELVALEGFITDITAHHQAEIERGEALLREQRAREEYTRLLILSQETERRRIAAELHDSLGQNLFLIKNRAQLALADKTIAAPLRQQLEGISQLVSQTVSEIRQISHDLHPRQVEHLGLTRALEAMIDRAAQSSGVAIERKLDFADDVFSSDAAANLYRIVQESLNNILKHSGAKLARVELERDLREVLVHITDNGCGFDPGKGKTAGGIGLRNMTERVHILGGKLKVNSQSNRGTRIEVAIPIADLE